MCTVLDIVLNFAGSLAYLKGNFSVFSIASVSCCLIMSDLSLLSFYVYTLSHPIHFLSFIANDSQNVLPVKNSFLNSRCSQASQTQHIQNETIFLSGTKEKDSEIILRKSNYRLSQDNGRKFSVTSLGTVFVFSSP